MGAFIGPILGLFGSLIGGGAPSAPQAAPAPAPPVDPTEEEGVDPGSVLDREAAQARTRKRRKDASVQGGSLLDLQESATTQKTLLGE